MVENTDDLLLLLLRCAGKRAAVTTYEEETGASRAEAVQAVDRLARKHGIAETQLTSAGVGESNPIATNDTREGRALNRRVELQVLE